MKLSDFDYELPSQLIAQKSLEKRDDSKLMVVNKNSQELIHTSFSKIIDFLTPGDVLVLNDTKVIPARIICYKSSGGRVEIFFVEQLSENTFKALVKPSTRVRERTEIILGDGKTKLIVYNNEKNFRIVGFPKSRTITDILDEFGEVPLPPYIKRNPLEEDKNRYQTVYAKNSGAIAAPTAGLHFTNELLEKIKQKGILVTYVTLHVGYGTFMPITSENITKHKMHGERYSITKLAADCINRAKEEKRKVICVGTTTARALEDSARKDGIIVPVENRNADIFIYPPYDFKIIDGLITNFHLPRTTLLMLVCAFYSREKLLSAYDEAISKEYRFYSYGDAMFIS